MSYETPLTDSVAGNLRAELARRGKTSTDLARVLKISQSSASRRLNAQTAITLDDLDQISKQFEIDLSALLFTP